MATEQQVKAGGIARSAREKAAEWAKPGVKMLDLAEKIEQYIIEQGGKPAFPVNLSVNNSAAHYTPTADDATLVNERDVLKIDLGVHVEGFIVDTAFTIDFSGEQGKLVEAAEEALQTALATMKAGVNAKEVGAAIQTVITARGFKPVENLCGHLLEPWVLHAGSEIPNLPVHGQELQEGEVYAVEPFATTGQGRVREDGSFCEIYSVVFPKNVRMPASRKVLEIVAEEYRALPFAKRWLQEIPMLQLAVGDLQKQDVLHAYPLLRDVEGSLVAQAETTVEVESDGVKVLC